MATIIRHLSKILFELLHYFIAAFDTSAREFGLENIDVIQDILIYNVVTAQSTPYRLLLQSIRCLSNECFFCIH